MKVRAIPKVGQLLYHEELNAQNKIKSASLFYIDTKPVSKKPWFVTWVFQMEDFNGNGMEAQFHPFAGGAGEKYLTRVATDSDILNFIKLIKDSANEDEQKRQWVKIIEENKDLNFLLTEEKERLKKLLFT